MDELDELNFGENTRKVRWVNQEIGKKWKSWLEGQKGNFTNPETAAMLAREGYEKDLWKEFFEKNPNTDIESVALRGTEDGATLDSTILEWKHNGITNSKDITDDIRKDFAQQMVRLYTDSEYANPNDLHYGMMDNLYHPETVRENNKFNASLVNDNRPSTASPSRASFLMNSQNLTSTASPSRASLLNQDDHLPLWMRIAKGPEPYGPNHPLVKEHRQGIVDGKYKPIFTGAHPSLEVMNDINQKETIEEKKKQQEAIVRMYKRGQINDNGSFFGE